MSDDGSIYMDEDTSSESSDASLPSPTRKSRLQENMTLLDGTFFKCVPQASSSSSNTILATCVMCSPKTVQIKGYRNCTSNFISHLKRKHGDMCVADYRNYLLQRKGGKSKLNYTNLPSKSESTRNQDSFDSDFIEFFIQAMIPLRAVENPYFKNIFEDFEMKLMSRRTLGRRLNDFYSNQMASTKEKLKNVAYVCTSADVWSSRKRSFLSVTAHWIDSRDLRRKTIALACTRFTGSRIPQILTDVHDNFDLVKDNKLIATIIDSGTDLSKAFSEFGVKIENVMLSDECFEIDGETSYNTRQLVAETEIAIPFYRKCNAHELSLCATTDANKVLNDEHSTLFELHKSVMIKCNILWKTAGHPKSADIIFNTLGHTLRCPGATGWNSLFDSLKQIANIKEMSSALHKALALKNQLREMDFQYIDEYLLCSSPLAEALDILQGQSDCYFGIVLPCLLALRRKLEKNTFKNLRYCKELAEIYLKSVKERFDPFFELSSLEAENAAIAALSFPRFKNKWISCFSSSKHSKIQNLFTSAIAARIEITNSKDEHQKHLNRQDNDFFSFDSDSDVEEKISKKSSPKFKAELLALQFFAEESGELNILFKYPDIKEVFLKYNTPLPSSGPGMSKSCALSDHLFEKRLVLKENLNFEKNQEKCN